MHKTNFKITALTLLFAATTKCHTPLTSQSIAKYGIENSIYAGVSSLATYFVTSHSNFSDKEKLVINCVVPSLVALHSIYNMPQFQLERAKGLCSKLDRENLSSLALEILKVYFSTQYNDNKKSWFNGSDEFGPTVLLADIDRFFYGTQKNIGKTVKNLALLSSSYPELSPACQTLESTLKFHSKLINSKRAEVRAHPDFLAHLEERHVRELAFIASQECHNKKVNQSFDKVIYPFM